MPRWRADGKEIFYRSGDKKMMSAAVTASGDTFSAAVPQALFVLRNVRGYDVSADGQRFLMLYRLEEETSPAITVVLNWTAELRKP